MGWQVVWLFAAPTVAAAGIVWAMFAMIHADEAKSGKKNTSTDA